MYDATLTQPNKTSLNYKTDSIEIDYIQQLYKNGIIENTHRLLWDQVEKDEVVKLEFETQSKKEGGQESRLDVLLGGVYLTYRKEFVEFFIGFFAQDTSSEDVTEATDQVSMRMFEEYENLKSNVTMQNMMETAQVTKDSNFKLNLTSKSLIGFIPVYGHKDATDIKEKQGFGNNYLIEVHDKPAWILSTGTLYFHNDE